MIAVGVSVRPFSIEVFIINFMTLISMLHKIFDDISLHLYEIGETSFVTMKLCQSVSKVSKSA